MPTQSEGSNHGADRNNRTLQFFIFQQLDDKRLDQDLKTTPYFAQHRKQA